MTHLRLEHVSKHFGKQRLIEGMDCQLGVGCYAIQGHNGSGKSTLLQLLAGVQSPTSGRIRVLGKCLKADPQAARAQLSWVPDKVDFYPFLSPQELLTWVANLRNCSVDAALAAAQDLALVPHLDTRMGVLSMGTQRKVALAISQVCHTPVWLLDEPSIGLDTDAKSWLSERMRLRAENSCVLFSSHDKTFCEAADAVVMQLHPNTLRRAPEPRDRH